MNLMSTGKKKARKSSIKETIQTSSSRKNHLPGDATQKNGDKQSPPPYRIGNKDFFNYPATALNALLAKTCAKCAR